MGQKSMDHAEVYACVKELARASGIPVKKEQLPGISLHGYYSPSENAITINSNLEDTKACLLYTSGNAAAMRRSIPQSICLPEQVPWN